MRGWLWPPLMVTLLMVTSHRESSRGLSAQREIQFCDPLGFERRWILLECWKFSAPDSAPCAEQARLRFGHPC